MSIKSEEIKQSCELLRVLLASTSVLRVKTQNFHWHVTGINFINLHELFEKQYDELGEAIDEIAERIRALKENSLASMVEFLKFSILEESPAVHNQTATITALLNDHEKMSEFTRKSINELDENTDESTKDIFNSQLAYHEKTAWFLRSHLG